MPTSFLFDRHREAEEAALRQTLSLQWQAQQLQIQREPLQVTFSYWDGSGHRRTLSLLKGQTVGGFLEAARRLCVEDFSELRVLSGEGLLYVKEDLIIPHHLTFYDLIVTRGAG